MLLFLHRMLQANLVLPKAPLHSPSGAGSNPNVTLAHKAVHHFTGKLNMGKALAEVGLLKNQEVLIPELWI